VIRNLDYLKYIPLALQKQNMSFDMRLLHYTHAHVCMHTLVTKS